MDAVLIYWGGGKVAGWGELYMNCGNLNEHLTLLIQNQNHFQLNERFIDKGWGNHTITCFLVCKREWGRHWGGGSERGFAEQRESGGGRAGEK